MEWYQVPLAVALLPLAFVAFFYIIIGAASGIDAVLNK